MKDKTYVLTCGNATTKALASKVKQRLAHGWRFVNPADAADFKPKPKGQPTKPSK